LNFDGIADGITPDDLVSELLEHVPQEGHKVPQA
jgi:hypothetical protein